MKQLLRSVGFILIFYSVAPNVIHEMTLAQKIMFGLGASWLFYEGGKRRMRAQVQRGHIGLWQYLSDRLLWQLFG
ncbi:hypothetical protein [Streptococcus suis]|uniref:Uncharacterized protein n=1 Tax=Streptococcus suis TaxID=1307 RepID=A0AAW9DFJ8_STRSU|nr:hypothetical protein [Streptococcus suis]MBM0273129.1 hypothetical protein [Streptococcus suis]MDX5037831.1 hypothetical protein [Streptococcus suis]NQJ50140.1 hypothetical protein [Streptococcus suis]NQJ52109.1 hypothetical protein [Streptococcus suis]NQJ56463.1 hypothetical protein [Streptococcus suis]